MVGEGELVESVPKYIFLVFQMFGGILPSFLFRQQPQQDPSQQLSAASRRSSALPGGQPPQPLSQRAAAATAAPAVGASSAAMEAAMSDDAGSMLDLHFITGRLLASGMLWKQRTERKSHRNNLDEMARFLQRHFPQRCMIWNLTAQEYDTSAFQNQVVSFPIHRNSMLTLKTLFDITRSLDAWLDIDPRNIALVHCHNGKSRTGLIVASYLRYTGEFDSVREVGYRPVSRGSSDTKGLSILCVETMSRRCGMDNGLASEIHPILQRCHPVERIPAQSVPVGSSRCRVQQYS